MLAQMLRDIGLGAGDSVIVHSSLRSLGPVESGPEGVIDALLEAVGPHGNLMLPTFNYSHPLPQPHYDRVATACRTGAIPETGRKRPEAIRSLHPTHSVAVIGPDARELTDDHLSVRAFGVGSPIDRLAQRGGKVLLLGVGHTSNSTIHVGEEHGGLPKPPKDYHPGAFAAKVLLPDGKVIEHALDSSPSCSAAFEAAALPLRQAQAIRDGRIGGCLVQLMPGQAVIDAVVCLIHEHPGAMLCTNPNCVSCTGVRRNLVTTKGTK